MAPKGKPWHNKRRMHRTMDPFAGLKLANFRDNPTIQGIRDGTLPATRSCDDKLKMGRWMAQQAAERMQVEQGTDVDAYACLYCGWWHIGHRIYRKGV